MDTNQTLTKVTFDDTESNWVLWGQLAEQWITGGQPRPEAIPALVAQAAAQGITNFAAPGPQNRPVVFYEHDDLNPAAPLSLCLPTPEVLYAVRDQIPASHPMPTFYDRLYDGGRKPLSPGERLARCRLGEYTIQYCC